MLGRSPFGSHFPAAASGAPVVRTAVPQLQHQNQTQHVPKLAPPQRQQPLVTIPPTACSARSGSTSASQHASGRLEPSAAQSSNGTPKGERRMPQHAQTLPPTSLEIPRGYVAEHPAASSTDDDPLNISSTTLCSTVHNQPHAISRSGRTDRLIPGAPPAAPAAVERDCDLAVHVQEGLARLTSRFDSYFSDQHQESSWVNAEIRRVREEAAELKSGQAARVEELEKLVDQRGQESEQTLREQQALREQVEALQKKLEKVEASSASRIDELARGLASEADVWQRGIDQEAEARAELQVVMGKEIRQHCTLEIERIQAAATREMRERMDGQKVIRDEVQFQQQALNHLQSKVDEMLMELRTEMPRLSQELSDRADDLQANSEAQLETFERCLQEEATARRAEKKAMEAAFRDQAAAEAARLAPQLADLRQSSDASSIRVRSAEERLEQSGRQVAELEEGLQRASRRMQAVGDDVTRQIDELERKLAENVADVRETVDSKVLESESGLRGWVKIEHLEQTQRVDSLKSAHKDSEDAIRMDVVKQHEVSLSRVSELDGRLDKSLKQLDAGLRSWIDSAVMARVTALEASMRSAPKPGSFAAPLAAPQPVQTTMQRPNGHMQAFSHGPVMSQPVVVQQTHVSASHSPPAYHHR